MKTSHKVLITLGALLLPFVLAGLTVAYYRLLGGSLPPEKTAYAATICSVFFSAFLASCTVPLWWKPCNSPMT